MKVADLAPSYDVAIVGAGPAGLAAAAVAARAGLSTVVFDENLGVGGQIYRAITSTPVADRAILGADYWAGTALVEEAKASGALIVNGATVWSLNPSREIGVSMEGAARTIDARRVIIATGALERPFPIPGWTMPGVMSAGGAQTLLKAHGMLPEGHTVIAGCGPLLWLLAAQILRAGGKIDAILDTQSRGNWQRAWPHALNFMVSPYFRKGLSLVREVKRAVKVIRVDWLEAVGDDKVREVAFGRAGGREHRLPVDQLLLYHGVVPNLNLALAAGIAPAWDERQYCWVTAVDARGDSLVDGIAVAGDGEGIGGATAAAERGRLAALAAVKALKPGALSSLPKEDDVRRKLRREERGRAFLDTLFLPGPQFRRPLGDTIICRCEEVTAQQVRDTTTLGCQGPNQMKAFLRCGMGPCQGRMCGLTVTELIAEVRGVAPAEVGYYRLRPPVKPITLAELASLPIGEAERKAVER